MFENYSWIIFDENVNNWSKTKKSIIKIKTSILVEIQSDQIMSKAPSIGISNGVIIIIIEYRSPFLYLQNN